MHGHSGVAGESRLRRVRRAWAEALEQREVDKEAQKRARKRVAVEDIDALRPWLRALLITRLQAGGAPIRPHVTRNQSSNNPRTRDIGVTTHPAPQPMLAACFPRLADGSTCGDRGGRIRVHDAFIVRYAAADASLSLPEHRDTSSMSFTLALNGDEGDFDGGGTWFGALGDAGGDGLVVNAEPGHAVGFAGPLRHAGYPITRGTRFAPTIAAKVSASGVESDV